MLFDPYIEIFREQNKLWKGAAYCASAGLVLFAFVLSGLPILNYLSGQPSRLSAEAAADPNQAPSVDGVSVNGPAITLNPGVAIVLDASEPLAVKKAVADLQIDLQKVLGQPSTVVNTLAAAGNKSAIVVSYQGASTSTLRDTTLTSSESHQVSVRAGGGVNYLVAQGADLRGTIYAVYTLSDKYLGVPPLWYWSNWQPQTKATLSVAVNGGIRVGSPQVQYRSWFLNNQDLWTKFNPAVDKYDMLYQTMLRLKLNTYYIGEGIGLYGGSTATQSQQANDRGLVIASNTLAMFRAWDQYWTEYRGLATAPALSLANQAKVEEYWKSNIQYAVDKKLDVLWVLGFRGRNDGGFWGSDDFIDAPTTDIARGDVIENQTKKQMSLIRTITGQTHPKMAMLLWNELSDLLDNGTLQPPVDADLTWAFSNDVRDHFPGKGARTYALPSNQPYGYYMNLQFYSTGAHLAEAEGPWKMTQNFATMQSRRPGGKMGFGEINMGNVREFLLTGTAAADMMWNIGNYSADAGVNKLMSRYFGATQATQLTTYYKNLMDSYWNQKNADISGFSRQYVFQDLRIRNATMDQLAGIRARNTDMNLLGDNYRIVYTDTGQQSEVGAVMKGSQNSASAFNTLSTNLTNYATTVPASSRAFYTDTFQVPSQFLLAANKTLYNVTRAYYTLKDPAVSSCYLQTAKTESSALRPALNLGNHDQFITWYNSEDLFGIADVQASIDTAIASLPKATCGPDGAPVPTPTPTPTPTSVTATSFGSINGLSASTTKDAKRTLFKTNAAINLSQVSCYSCGSGVTMTLYKSDVNGVIGTKVGSATTTTAVASWNSANLAPTLTANTYYVLEFVPSTVPVHYGSTANTSGAISFLKYATAGAPTWKGGAWMVQLAYK